MTTDRRAARTIWLGVGGIIALLIVLWAASPGAVELWRASERGAEAPPPLEELPMVSLPAMPVTETEIGDPPDLSWMGAVFGVIVAVVLLAVLVMFVRWLLTLRFTRRRRDRVRVAGAEAGLPEIAEAVRDAEQDLYAALRSGSPRNAIVDCWVRLEAAVTDAGARPRLSETSAELTERVLGQFSLDDSSLLALGSLYREARFSEHELGEADRERAIRALQGLAESLRVEAPEPDEVPT